MTDKPPVNGESAPGARLFFALWPDLRVQAELARAAARLGALCGGRRTPAAKIHVTLAFLGEVALSRVEALRAAAAQVKGAAFDLNFAKLGWWRRNRVAWAGPEDTPAELARLADGLRAALREADFRFDRKTCVPHATLLRKADCRELPSLAAPIPWRVEQFVLVRSRLAGSGSAYEIIGRWPLSP